MLVTAAAVALTACIAPGTPGTAGGPTDVADDIDVVATDAAPQQDTPGLDTSRPPDGGTPQLPDPVDIILPDIARGDLVSATDDGRLLLLRVSDTGSMHASIGAGLLLVDTVAGTVVDIAADAIAGALTPSADRVVWFDEEPRAFVFDIAAKTHTSIPIRTTLSVVPSPLLQAICAMEAQALELTPALSAYRRLRVVEGEAYYTHESQTWRYVDGVADELLFSSASVLSPEGVGWNEQTSELMDVVTGHLWSLPEYEWFHFAPLVGPDRQWVYLAGKKNNDDHDAWLLAVNLDQENAEPLVISPDVFDYEAIPVHGGVVYGLGSPMKTYTHHFWSLYGGDITLMDPACAVEDATSRYVAWTANCQEPTLPLELAVFDAEVGALVYASTVIGPHNAFIAGDHLMYQPDTVGEQIPPLSVVTLPSATVDELPMGLDFRAVHRGERPYFIVGNDDTWHRWSSEGGLQVLADVDFANALSLLHTADARVSFWDLTAEEPPRLRLRSVAFAP